MHPKSMSAVIGGKRYNTATATLIADDEYWDGHNFERGGRNSFLYRTKGGAFFEVTLTQWQGERNSIEPLTREDAMRRWDELTEHAVSYEEAFDVVVEEAAEPGRPAMYGEKMRQTAIWLPEEMIAWLKSQPGTLSETVRALIAAAMPK